MNFSFKTVWTVGFGVALGATTGLASAAAITPTSASFGTLSQATFGGSGIPNDAVAFTTYSGGSLINPLTIGLSATQRFGNPALTNNGAGIFTAQAGGDTLNGQPAYAKWNFDIHIDGDTRFNNFAIFYDFDPASGNDQSTHGITGPLLTVGSNDFYGNSLNLGMGFLNAGPFQPAYPSFNPSSLGQYTFALVSFDKSVGNGYSSEVGRVAIQVNVVPEPEAYGLALAGMGVVAFAMRRRRKAAA